MEKLTDKIDRYLDGKLNAEEKSAFETEIKNNPDLQNQIKIQQNLRAGIERIGMKKEISSSFRKMTLKNKIYKWGIATVAVAAIGTASYFGYNQVNKTDDSNLTYELPALNEDGKAEWANADKNLPTQLFSINPSKDTVIETINGLVFAIPAGAFLNATDPVTLEIREAITPMDIMNGGLSTMSDGKALETGGMFYLNARNGENSLKINPEKPVYANVPANEIKPGMMLFEGERKSDGSINWKNPKPIEKELMPVDIQSLNFYPKGFLEKIAELGFYANEKKVSDSVYYSYAGRYLNYPNSVIQNGEERFIIPSGEALFKANCSSCHYANEKKSTGPGLKGVLSRIPAGEWKYNWVHNSQAFIHSGDKYAVHIFMEYNQSVMTAFPQLKDEDIDAILRYADNGGYEGDEINPARIAAIWNDKFQNTIIATKEFEERLQVIFKYGFPSALDLYIENLDKPLYYIDSLVYSNQGETAIPEFRDFYLRHDGGISISKPHMRKLQNYYETKQKAVQLAAEKTFNQRLENEHEADRAHQESVNEQNWDYTKQYAQNFSKEFLVNLRDAYRQLGKPFNPNPIPPASYGFTITNTGWNNVDRYVSESTSTRTTLDYTDSLTGKKAVIKYEEVKININDAAGYEQLSVYLVADSLPCFMKINPVNGIYAEKLDELMHYSLVVIGQKGKQWFSSRRDHIQPGTVEVHLDQIAESQLRTDLNAFSKSMGTDFGKEVNTMIEARNYKIDLQNRKKQEEIDQEIMKVIFAKYYTLPVTAQAPATDSIRLMGGN